jgi:hypothetical protein
LGPPVPIAPADIDALHVRYQTAYGQPAGSPAGDVDAAR